jgi:hypothetical protein
MKDYFRTIIRPRQTFEGLILRRDHFSMAFRYMLIPITGYTLMYIFLAAAGGAPSVFNPWLDIPKEKYYLYNQFLLAPSMILAWFASVATIQAAAHAVKGIGTFEQTLCVVGLSISISMLGGLIHDLPMSFLSAAGVIDARAHEAAMNSPTIYRTLLWFSYSLYLAGFLILFPMAVRVAHKLTMTKSILIGELGFIIFQTTFLVFNR